MGLFYEFDPFTTYNYNPTNEHMASKMTLKFPYCYVRPQLFMLELND